LLTPVYKLSIVFPCYNEANSLPELIGRCHDLNKVDIEFIFVNNGSEDDSDQILKNAINKDMTNFINIKVPINKGYGYGILEGLNKASGEFIGWTHADLQTDPSDLITVLEILNSLDEEQKNIFLKGQRHDRSWKDNIFSIGMSIFEFFMLGLKLWEINAQPTIFHRSIYKLWVNPPYDWNLDLYGFSWARKNKLIIKRFPVYFLNRKHDESHWNKGLWVRIKFILRTMKYSFKLKKDLKLNNLEKLEKKSF